MNTNDGFIMDELTVFTTTDPFLQINQRHYTQNRHQRTLLLLRQNQQ